MVNTAMAGLAMRLVQRLEVRHEPVSASTPATNAAAAGPSANNTRNRNISPAAKEVLVPGRRIGNNPAPTANTIPKPAAAHLCQGVCNSWETQASVTALPPNTISHQYTAARRL